MKAEFQKISGAKNIFLIGDKLKNRIGINQEALIESIIRICDPFDGFCADGVVFIEPVSDGTYSWEFYNSDGSSAEMCGNAVRCAHRYIHKRFAPETETISIHTISGKVTSTLKGEFYYVQMPVPKDASELFLTSEFFNNASLFRDFENVSNGAAYFVDTGVPHLVISIHDWESALELLDVWLFLRHHSYFKKGTNVTLVQSQKFGSALAASYERGVDDFTQACGTGAVAAALYIGQVEKLKTITIMMPGGDLKVDISKPAPVLIGQTVDVGHVVVDL